MRYQEHERNREQNVSASLYALRFGRKKLKDAGLTLEGGEQRVGR